MSRIIGSDGQVVGATGASAADDVSFDPAGSIAATDVQAAIEELDAEKQPLDSDLTDFAALSPTNDDIVQRKAGAWTNRTIAQLLTDLGLGSVYQPLDTELSALAALTSAADRVPYFTGSGAAALATFGAVGRSLAAIGSNVDPWGLESGVSGCLAESIPRSEVNNNFAGPSTGRVGCVLIPVLAGMVITNVSWLSATTAMSAQTNWWFALLNSTYNVIRQATDQLNGGAWAANSLKTLAVDSIPTTAGARAGSTTVTLTIPTLAQTLTDIVAVNDSVVVSNANIAAYNGTFTVTGVTGTTVTYTAGSSATDSLSAPFPTVQLAAGKRTYTVPSNGYVVAAYMVKGTVPTHAAFAALAGAVGVSPVKAFTGDSSLTGTCPSPVTLGSNSTAITYAALS